MANKGRQATAEEIAAANAITPGFVKVTPQTETPKVSAERVAQGKTQNALNAAKTLGNQISNGTATQGSSINALIRAGSTPKEASYLSRFNDSFSILGAVNQAGGKTQQQAKQISSNLARKQTNALLLGEENKEETPTEQAGTESKGFGSWLSNVLKSGFSSSGSNLIGTERALYEKGQDARTARYEEELAQKKTEMDRWKRAMDEETALGNDATYAVNAYNKAKAEYDAYAKVVDENVQQKATKATSDLSNEIGVKAGEYSQAAKNAAGNTTFGNIATDLGVAATQLGIDAATNLFLPGASKAMLAARSFGGAAQEAEAEGASINQQLLYGGANAATELLTEKMFDGLASVYGKGAADDIVNGVIRKVTKNPKVAKALGMAAGGIGEATEEGISGAVSPLLKFIYDNGASLKESFGSKEGFNEYASNVLYDMLVGGLLGFGMSAFNSNPLTQTKPTTDTVQQKAEQSTEQTAPQTTQTAEQTVTPTVETVATEVSKTPTLDTMLTTGRGINALAEDIINNPTAYAEFESTRPAGENLVSKAEKRKAIKEYLNSKRSTVQTAETVQPTPVQTRTTEQTTTPIVEQTNNDTMFDSNGNGKSYIRYRADEDIQLSSESQQVYDQINEIGVNLDTDTSKDLGDGYSVNIKNGRSTTPTVSVLKDGKVISTFEYERDLAGTDPTLLSIIAKDIAADKFNGTQTAQPTVQQETQATPNADNWIDDSDVDALIRQNEQNALTNARNKNAQNSANNATDGVTQEIAQPTAETPTQEVKPKVNQEQTATEQTTAETTTKVEDTSGLNVSPADLEGAKETYDGMKTLPPEEKEAGNSRNTRTNKRMPEEFRAEVEKDPDMYKVAHNKETLDAAISIVENNGVGGAVDILQGYLADARNGMKMPLESAPLAKILINELYKDGSEVSKDIARQIQAGISAEMTYAGQFAQANVILRNADPLTRLQTFQKYIDKINKTIENNFNKRYTYRAELTQDEINRINSTDFGDSADAMESMRDEIITRVGREMPSTVWQKFLSLSKTGMLSLPATHAGNFLANVPTAGLRKLNNLFAGAMQKVGTLTTKLTEAEIPTQVDGMWTSKVNGKEYSSENKAEVTAWAKAEKYGRTRAAFYGSESMNVAKEVYDSIKDELGKDSNKWETGNAVLREQTIIKPFKALQEWGQNNADKFNDMMTSKFGKNVPKADASITQTAMNFISWAMEVEDQPFVKAAFVNSLASYCEARGITSAKGVTPEAIAHATIDAMYYTYKNTNTISQVFQTLKRGGTRNGKVDVLSDALGVVSEVKVPFVNTVANIGLMAVEHDPVVATAKAIAEAIKGAGNKQIIDTVSKGMTGGLVIGLGALLRSANLLSGAEEEDKDKKAWMTATGQKANALLGKLDISQFQPIAQLLSFGANLYDNYVNNKNTESTGQIVLDALWDSADGVLDMEMLQNISEMFGSNDDYKDEGKAQAFFNSFIADMPSRVIPNVWKGVQNSEDMTNRYYKFGDTTIDQVVNAFKYVSGWGREDLPENVNVKGTSNKGNALLNTFDSMLYPGQIAQGEMNEEDKYLLKLEKEIGDKSMYPQKFKAGETYHNAAGEEIEVGYEDVGQFQKTYSKTYYDALSKMRESKEFNALPSASKKKAISTIESLAKDVAKAEAFKNKGIEYTSDYQKIIEGDDDKNLPALGIDGAISYYMYKDGFDNAVKNKDYTAIDKDVARFENMDKDIKTVLFAKDDDLRNLVNASDYDIKSKTYYKYRDELKPAASRYGNSTTSSVTKLSALATAGISNDDISKIIANNVFDLSSTSLAAVEILTQAPYSLPLNEVADFLYETDYTKNKKYENNDIIDLGKKSVNQTTRRLAKDIENGTIENTDENMEMLYGALVMEDANVNGIEGGTANGTLSNLEMANSLSTSENPILKNNANAIYNAFKNKLSNYFNDWGNYSYQSEVNYLPKSKANGYEYGRKINALTQPSK